MELHANANAKRVEKRQNQTKKCPKKCHLLKTKKKVLKCPHLKCKKIIKKNIYHFFFMTFFRKILTMYYEFIETKIRVKKNK